MGLATSAGLNAYIPLMLVGLLARFTHLITLPPSWHWLQNGWVLAILAVLLAIEFVADKVPVVDHVNDVLQTFVRPTAGGVAFGAATSSQTVTVHDPGSFFSSHQWVPIAAGIVISLTVHGMKAGARPVVNATTAGFGAPVISTIEDIISVALSLVAIVLPVLVLVFVGGLIAFFWWAMRRRARRKVMKQAQRAAREAERMARLGYPGSYPGGYPGGYPGR
jgi:glucan phosphoethanolaminetransferase (alkaline phosphatase superfamily)